MKARLDMDKIAKGLGGERRGRVEARAGYFGAVQLLADLETRLRAPASGGRPTDPQWTVTGAAQERQVMVKVDCGPCMKRRCPLDHRCMTQISSQAVLGKAEEIMRSTVGSR